MFSLSLVLCTSPFIQVKSSYKTYIYATFTITRVRPGHVQAQNGTQHRASSFKRPPNSWEKLNGTQNPNYTCKQVGCDLRTSLLYLYLFFVFLDSRHPMQEQTIPFIHCFQFLSIVLTFFGILRINHSSNFYW